VRRTGWEEPRGRVGSDIGPAYLGTRARARPSRIGSRGHEGLEHQGRARLEARAATGERVAW
jgi:hypothetical protein